MIKTMFQRLQEHMIERGEDECWPWSGAINKDGFGQIYYSNGIKRTTTTAHRASYLFHGGVATTHDYILHNCQNHSCVNPKHLYKGTPKDVWTRQLAKKADIEKKLNEAKKEKHKRSYVLPRGFCG